MKWRVGPIPIGKYAGMGKRAVYRCVRADGSPSDEDTFIGIMDSDESARLLVARLNGEVECRCAVHARQSEQGRENQRGLSA